MAWTAPRTWVSSEVVTAAQMNAHIRDNLNAINGFVRKTADESVTSSTTLQNDDHLLYTIDATGTYLFDAWLFANSAADNAGDIKYGFSFPTGTVIFGGVGLVDTVTTGSSGSDQAIAFTTPTSGSSAISYATSNLSAGFATMVYVHGILIATATGTLRLVWAQNSSNASATTLKSGSHMLVRQVA